MTTIEAPDGRYRIAEVSRLTGFAPTTLRYYENAGVLAPPQRTTAGYRLYGDRDVERLRLIARAKELGCTLEEISGLVEAWDADECGPVKHRLLALVHVKVADVQRHITEQTAFAAQLQSTAAALASRPVDGPCDDGCGCTTAPIACSLGGGDMKARIHEWQSLLVGVEHREAVPNGVRLVFGPAAPLGEIARLAAAEYECCPFFTFVVTIDERGTALEVRAPADGQVLLDAVFGGVDRPADLPR